MNPRRCRTCDELRAELPMHYGVAAPYLYYTIPEAEREERCQRTLLSCYPSTLSLKTQVHTRAVGRRPRIELEPTDHPLAMERRTGITRDRVREIAEAVMHG